MIRAGPLALVAGLFASLGAVAATPATVPAKDDREAVLQALNDWDLATAKAKLAALATASPSGEVVFLHGLVAFEEGRYPEAVAHFEKAGARDDADNFLRLARETERITRDHAKRESEHFIFSFPPGKDELLAPYALETLEQMRTAMLEDLDYAPEGKVRVELLNDGRELAKISTLSYEQIKATGTIAVCKFSKLMVTSPKAVLRGYDWRDTLAHEYVHLVVSQMSRNRVPIWLHEGLAKYLESRWRGEAGLALGPSTRALLGRRIAQGRVIPFEKMHPSIAMLPTAEDAATAFAEVFFAIDLLYRDHGRATLPRVVEAMKAGVTDKQAVVGALAKSGSDAPKSFAAFEKAWMAHMKKQPFPSELIPLTSEKVVLKDDGNKKGGAKKKEREISFGDFAEITDVSARRSAHLGELLRERTRVKAAAEEYGKAHARVGDKYESLSNKYALALMELKRHDEAEKILLGSLRFHPTLATTHVHLGRLYLLRKQHPKARATYLEALGSDPFDREIHLALAKIHSQLGEKTLATRALRAVELLTGTLPGAKEETAPARAATEKSDQAIVLDAGLDKTVETP